MIKYSVICLFVIVSFANAFGQQLNLIKEEVLSTADFENDLKTEGAIKSSKYTSIYKDKKKSPLTSFPDANKSSSQNARWKGSYQGSEYYVVSDDATRSQTVVKKLKGKEIILKQFPQEGQFSKIGKNGNFLFSDIAHGQGSVYQFYSSDMKLLNSYRPYDFFSFSSYTILQGFIIMGTVEDTDSKKLKLSKLTLNGELVMQKEIELSDPMILDITRGSSHFSIITPGSIHPNNLIIYCDINLDIIWRKEVSAIPRNEIIFTNEDDIIYLTVSEVYLINADNGSQRWNYPLTRNKSFKLVLDKQYLAIVKGKEIQKELVLLDKKNGSLVYTDFVESDKRKPMIIEDGKQFFVEGSNEWIKFKKSGL